MPEQSPTTESKAATTPSVDLFGAGTGADIHFSVWNLFHVLWFPYVHFSVICLFLSPHTSWFVPHSGMMTVHVPTRSVLDCRCGCFFIYAVFLPATLTLFFAPPTSTFFLLSRILPLACFGKLDLPAVSRGPSPLPELAPAGDIVTGEFSCFTFTASQSPFLLLMKCAARRQTWLNMKSFAWSWCLHAQAHQSKTKSCKLQGCGYN